MNRGVIYSCSGDRFCPPQCCFPTCCAFLCIISPPGTPTRRKATFRIIPRVNYASNEARHLSCESLVFGGDDVQWARHTEKSMVHQWSGRESKRGRFMRLCAFRQTDTRRGSRGPGRSRFHGNQNEGPTSRNTQSTRENASECRSCAGPASTTCHLTCRHRDTYSPSRILRFLSFCVDGRHRLEFSPLSRSVAFLVNIHPHVTGEGSRETRIIFLKLLNPLLHAGWGVYLRRLVRNETNKSSPHCCVFSVVRPWKNLMIPSWCAVADSPADDYTELYE